MIHERHRRRLHAAAARALRSSGGDAEGVVQEAFLRAHRALRDDQPPARAQAVAAPRRAQPLHRRAAPQPAADDRARGRRPRRRGRGRLLARSAAATSCGALIEDLADLPEQQRAGAADARARRAQPRRGRERAGDHPQAASRQLVKRARTGLVAAAEARDADCAAIRERPADRPRRAPAPVRARGPPPARLLGLPRVPRRPEGHARDACARSSRRSASGPLAGVLHLLGGATAGGGVAAKVAAGGAAPCSPPAASTVLGTPASTTSSAAPRPASRPAGRR